MSPLLTCPVVNVAGGCHSLKMAKFFKHRCSFHAEQIPARVPYPDFWDRWRYRWFSWTLLMETNPMCSRYFRSEKACRNEKKRHYNSASYFTIHPLSRMAAYHDFFRCVLYIIAIAIKAIDIAFTRRRYLYKDIYTNFMVLMNYIDMISWVNIMILLFRGRIVHGAVVTDFPVIVRMSFTSVLFWAEILSSAPKFFLCTKKICVRPLWVFFNVIASLKLLLIGRLMTLIGRTMEYMGVKSKMAIFFVQLAYAVFTLNHIMACVVFALPFYRKYVVGHFHKDTWVLKNNLVSKPMRTQYIFAFFKASAQVFGVEIAAYKGHLTWEATIVNMFNYVVGKVINMFICVAVLHILLNRNIQEIKYQQVVGQMKNWMKNKELPSKIQQRVVDYYEFYYRKRYFNQSDINRLLSTSLKLKITDNTLRVLRESNVTIFGNLPDESIQQVLENFVMEVYCPNDVIMSCGSHGHFLYFLASGTVAVYTYSGKEVCHLQDGAYFGELSLLLKETHVTATIIAIETSKVYKLKKEHFERFVLSNKDIYEVLLKEAESRLKRILETEEAYRKLLFSNLYSGLLDVPQ
ncbi:potassium/sodium hyperpolarization-activated cyclic nucleotide-gated channel 4-like [Rhynchophorus ferrugineus]|uniref:potassium/sodium hyperpolarization-activated cyclic nucleotide-gated channel 4-like n=1 Tax=Rhynchophorus ferrugineus TaxID=354439 RepID=UPI003FCC8282